MRLEEGGWSGEAMGKERCGLNGLHAHLLDVRGLERHHWHGVHVLLGSGMESLLVVHGRRLT